MRLTRRKLALLSALAVLAAGTGCMHVRTTVPADLDTATSRLSAQGAYRVSYRSDATAVPVNRLHAWTLRVETSDGQPVTDASIKVDGDMPQHGHGMPTRPRVTRHLGSGEYLVEGMKFQMGGWWVVEVSVAAGGRSDVAQFNLMLPG